MAEPRFKSVEEYLAAQPEAGRGALESVRRAIGKALPGAEEAISYNIPTYKLHGTSVIHFAGWKQHYSLYPAGEAIRSKFREELRAYELDGKATIRFSFDQKVLSG